MIRIKRKIPKWIIRNILMDPKVVLNTAYYGINGLDKKNSSYYEGDFTNIYGYNWICDLKNLQMFKSPNYDDLSERNYLNRHRFLKAME